MAIVDVRPVAALQRRRGRAIAAWTTIRVEDAISSRHANIRAGVGRRAAAQAWCPRRTIRVGEAFVVRAPAGSDHALKWEATTISPAFALGVRGAGRCKARAVRLSGRCRTALRRAARRRSPMVDGYLRVAHQACSRFDEGRLASRDGICPSVARGATIDAARSCIRLLRGARNAGASAAARPLEGLAVPIRFAALEAN